MKSGEPPVPPPKARSRQHWDHHAFRVSMQAHYPGMGSRATARGLGINRRTFQRLVSGEATPTLRTYCAMICSTGLPFGTWLRIR